MENHQVKVVDPRSLGPIETEKLPYQVFTSDEWEQFIHREDTFWETYFYYPFWGMYHWVKDIPFRCRMRWQKWTRGFSDEESWALNYYGSKYMLPRLIHLRNNLHGWPGSFQSCEEWETVLDKIIWAIQRDLEFEDDTDIISYELLKTDTEEYHRQQERINEGYILLGRHWRCLWD